MTTERLDRRGLWVAVGSFVLWGVMPLYWHLLKSVPSMQIIAHRIVWSTLLVVGWLTWKYGRGWLRETLRQPRASWMLALSGIFIAFNWGLYIWAVNAESVYHEEHQENEEPYKRPPTTPAMEQPLASER